MSTMLVKFGRAAGAMAMAALGAFAIAACSAGEGEGEGYAGSEYEEIGDVGQGINKNCSGPTTVTTVEGGFATTYTNDTYKDCPGGKVVQIDDYSAKYAVGGYTELRWASPKPSDANCTGSLIWAYLFEKRGNEWVFIKSKSAHGDLLTDDVDGDIVSPPSQPKSAPDGSVIVKPTPGDLGGPIKAPPGCRTPVVYFHTSEMAAGKDYRIAATARLPSGSYQRLSYKSVAGTCGHESGDACCWAGEACVSNLACGSDDKCQECGAPGEMCCTRGLACDGRFSCQDETCKACGGRSQECCETGTPCDGNLTCSAGKCVQPAAPKCGDQGLACCTDGKKPCNGALECNGKTCQPSKPDDTCGGLGNFCCPGNTCLSKSLACEPALGGNRCGDPSASCSVDGDLCCPGKLAGEQPYCDNRFYSRIQCTNGTCVVP